MNYKANIIVKDNVVGQGRYSDGVTVTSYKYDGCGWCFGSGVITGNTFSGINSNGSNDMLKMTDTGCIIRNNKFIRDTSVINSYIANSDVDIRIGVSEITDNIFDQTTVDGYNEILVSGLNPTTKYTRNRNQTGFVYIPIWNGSIGSAGGFGSTYESAVIKPIAAQDGFIMRRTSQAITSKFNLMTKFTDAGGSDRTLNAVRSFDALSYLDIGMTIVDVRLGALLTVGDADDSITSFPSNFGVHLKYHDGTPNMDAANYTHDPFDQTDYTYTLFSSADTAALLSSTQYTTNTTSSFTGHADDNYYGFIQPDARTVGNGYEIEINFFANINFVIEYNIIFTPIEIKYKW